MLLPLEISRSSSSVPGSTWVSLARKVSRRLVSLILQQNQRSRTLRVVESFPPCTQVQQFVRSTFKEGLSQEIEDTIVEDENGIVELRYDVTIVESGAVLLNSTLEDLIESVECEGDGDTALATITLARPLDPSLFGVMFPQGAVLAIDSDVFGGCDFGGFDAVFEEPLEGSVLDTLDGYMNIDTVEAASDTVILVGGTPSSYFFLFQVGSISITPQQTNTGARSRDLQANCNAKAGPPASEPTDPTSWRIFKNVGVSLGADVDCDSLADLDYTLEGPTFEADFGIFSGLELTVDFTYGLSICAKFGCTFTASSQTKIALVSPTVSLPIPYVAIKLPIFGKVGLFLDSKLRFERIGRYEGSIGGSIILSGNIASYNYNFRVEGGWSGLDSTFTRTLLQPSSFSGDWVPVAESEGQTELFFGFQPAFAFYLGSAVKAEVSAKAGVSLLTTERSGQAVFEPVENDSVLPFLLGSCDECHDQEHDFGFTAKDLKFQFGITKKLGPLGVGDFGYFWQYMILANIFNLVIIKYCDPERVVEEELCETAAPTQAPTPRPTPVPTPQDDGGGDNGGGGGQPTDRGSGNDAGSSGDPHITTFSGKNYDCQGAGEFGMLQSPGSLFALQGRFTRFSSQQITVQTGVLIQDEGSATIQFSEALLTDPETLPIGGCPVHLFLDGELVPGPVGGTLDDSSYPSLVGVRVFINSGGSFRVTYDTGVDLFVEVAQSSYFGCWFHSSIYIPFSYRPEETLIGLLGSANGNADDGWLTREGSPLPFESGIAAGYNYCMANWMLSETDSLFSYETGKSYSDFEDNVPYTDTINLDNADQEVKDFCNGDENCLLEGLLGGIAAARDLQKFNAGLLIARGGGVFLTSRSAFALAGATVIDFESSTRGTYNDPLTVDGVTFDPGSSFLKINSGISNRNADGSYIENTSYGFERLDIIFETEVTAFGFNWGASNTIWTLTAYDLQNNVVASFGLPVIGTSNQGEFFGISGMPMIRAELVQGPFDASVPADYILIDNLSFVAANTGLGASTSAPTEEPTSTPTEEPTRMGPTPVPFPFP